MHFRSWLVQRLSFSLLDITTLGPGIVRRTGATMPIEAPAVPSQGGPPNDAETSLRQWGYGTIQDDSVETKSRMKTTLHAHSRLLAFGSLLLVSLFIWYGFVSRREFWQPLLPSVPAEHRLHISPILPPSYPLAVRSPYLSGKHSDPGSISTS